jgi:hypothetical protein
LAHEELRSDRERKGRHIGHRHRPGKPRQRDEDAECDGPAPTAQAFRVHERPQRPGRARRCGEGEVEQTGVVGHRGDCCNRERSDSRPRARDDPAREPVGGRDEARVEERHDEQAAEDAAPDDRIREGRDEREERAERLSPRDGLGERHRSLLAEGVVVAQRELHVARFVPFDDVGAAKSRQPHEVEDDSHEDDRDGQGSSDVRPCTTSSRGRCTRHECEVAHRSSPWAGASTSTRTFLRSCRVCGWTRRSRGAGRG